MTQPQVMFIAAGPYSWGSSRMRAYWIAQGLGADVIEVKDLKRLEADAGAVVVWQKQVNMPLVRETPHLRHVWDVCDPAWWWQPDQAREIVAEMDAVTFSTSALLADFQDWYSNGATGQNGAEPALHAIPDRLDLTHFVQRKNHDLHSPIRLIWYGLAVNRVALFGALANLERLAANGWGIELTICDDRPDAPLNFTNDFPVYHVPWSVEQENQIIAAHDIALLPPYPGAWGLVKSNNRALTAWACGLPVTQGDHYGLLQNLVGDERTRQADAEAGYQLVTDYYTVDLSVRQWQDVIGELAR